MRYLLFLSLSAIGYFSFGQDSTVVQDFETWNGVSVKKSFLEKKLDVKFNQELRLKDNSSRINSILSELEFGYDLNKRFNLSTGYRLTFDKKNDGYEKYGRWFADLNFDHKLDRFKFDYRLRYQHQQQFGVSKDDGDYPEIKYRLQAKVEYNIKKWKLDPYISGELFFAHQKYRRIYVDEVIEPTENINAFEKFRLTVGTSYSFNKVIELSAFYRLEREFKSYPLFYNTPATYYIGGIQLNFKL